MIMQSSSQDGPSVVPLPPAYVGGKPKSLFQGHSNVDEYTRTVVASTLHETWELC
jgi:hypothetical protein